LPYYRPPHPNYGNYYWNDGWGWFFTAAVVGGTLAYVTSLPSDGDCQKINDGGETLYQCDGTLYRSTYYKDEKVYEVVSDPPGAQTPAEPVSVIGLSLTQPLTRGDLVRDLQERLVYAGYDVGGVDGVYGSGTESALMWFQYDNGLDSSGVVDVETAKLLGYEAPAIPGAPPAAEEAAAPATAAPADQAPAEATATEPAPEETAPAAESPSAPAD